MAAYESVAHAIRATGVGKGAEPLDGDFLWFLAVGVRPAASRLPRRVRTRLERLERDLPTLIGSPLVSRALDPAVEAALNLVCALLHSDELLQDIEQQSGRDLRASAAHTSRVANHVLAALEVEFRRVLHRPARPTIVALIRTVRPDFFENRQDPIEVVRKRAATVPKRRARAYLETLRQRYTDLKVPLPRAKALLALLPPLVSAPRPGHARTRTPAPRKPRKQRTGAALTCVESRRRSPK